LTGYLKKILLKIALISFLALFLCFNAFAQTNYYKLSLGAGYGLTQSFADVESHDFGQSIYGTLDYFLTPFLSMGGELQSGKIKGGNVATDPHERAFVNSYKTATLNGKLYLGALLDDDRSAFLKAIRWLYAGGGAGIIRNNLTTIARVQKSTGYKFPGRSASYEMLIPINLGINFYFPDKTGHNRFAINLNFQSNLTLGEGLDGYDDSPTKFRNGFPDIYNYYTIGMKYHLGILGLSKKSLY
jgi:hypothetical protein